MVGLAHTAPGPAALLPTRKAIWCRTLFQTIVVALLTSPAFAGAWVQDRGAGLLIHQLTYFSAGHYYNRDGHRTPQPRFHKLEYQPYIEYGIGRRYTVGGSASLQRDWQGGSNNTGIADPELFLRGRIYHDDRQIVSLQPLIKLPSIFMKDGQIPRGGSHSADAELSLLYGRNVAFISVQDYVDVRLGYRARSRGMNGQIRADVALAVAPEERWQIIPAVRYVRATSLDRSGFSQNGEQDYDLLKAELAVTYQLDSARTLQATVFDHHAGKQVGAGQGASIGYAVAF